MKPFELTTYLLCTCICIQYGPKDVLVNGALKGGITEERIEENPFPLWGICCINMLIWILHFFCSTLHSSTHQLRAKVQFWRANIF